MIEKVPCLYCQTENTLDSETTSYLTDPVPVCCHCGMALPKAHPSSRFYKTRVFLWAFVFIALFCLLMIIYLPR
ncbi:DnrP protein [Shewanella sp. Choline-02u-19]|uniref:DnrP protein n=1 Tax=unclassified Shewanella TaxID=196818 RepID=UPI000C327346|nr:MULTISPECIES: DnrP protein [unclassified Shewanella]PKG56464.1 DnrP protein [Shewanella sp. GutDb-MelDb]PKG76643.1 DnrP protein [Shewanella sp. GutCb]PKH54600.1 DnrP protein [Shewanella sp. Bg11-22]PKI28658.1 DnrP protein [Shewanella sp. Choline-02u-19]